MVCLHLCCCFLAYPEVVNSVTGQITDEPTRGQSSHGLVNSSTNSLKCLIKNLEYVIAPSVISDRLHYLYAADELELGLRLMYN